MNLSSYSREQYLQDGYLLVPQLINAKTIEAQRKTIESYVDQKIQYLLEVGKIDNPHEEASFETRWELVSQQLVEPKDRPSQWFVHLRPLHKRSFGSIDQVNSRARSQRSWRLLDTVYD